jgi:hypothetical protein
MENTRDCWCRYPEVVVTHDRYPYECAVCGGVVRSVGRYGHDWRAVTPKKRRRGFRRGFWAEVLPVFGRVMLYGLAFLYFVLIAVFIAAIGEP